MNSYIQLKGVREQIFVKASEALKVKEMWEDNSVEYHHVINVGNTSFTKGDIKMVVSNNDKTKGEIWDGVMKDFYDEERRNRNALANKSAESKANMLDMFFQLHKIALKQEPNKETMDMAYKVQLDFFMRNPRRTLCDAHLLKALIPGLVPESSSKLWDSAISMYREAYFRLVDKAIFRDMQLSGQLESSYMPKPPIEAKHDETIIDMKNRAQDNKNSETEFNNVVEHALNNF